MLSLHLPRVLWPPKTKNSHPAVTSRHPSGLSTPLAWLSTTTTSDARSAILNINNIRILRTLNIRYNLSSSRCRMAPHAWANQCMRTSKREYTLRPKLQPLNSSKHSSLFVVTPQTHCWASRSTVVDRGPQKARVQEGHYD